MKKITIFVFSIFLFSLQGACKPSNDNNKEAEAIAQKEQNPVQTDPINGLKKAYFASGCFWCVEAVYESINGVKEAISGYSGGQTENPTYENHADHAEAVEVIYDPEIVSFTQLVDVYFGSQNITQVNGQGPDHGKSYRSIAFYQNDSEKKIIDEKIAALNKQLDGDKVAAQVLPFQKFWDAENYHQNYERNNPGNPYIQNVSIPRLNKFKEKFPKLLKKDSGH
ncbi:peptide-methionine (S)-S-oxide reductase MsrA [Aequorivita lipolytica]|uniref:Peptide methionine sulfoxide reductase MsrA n=1 Tax=Aequorivita lipolytica TaxID=153267 RepID=A0A5C6YNQ5_9FLAO|nr:peptide-methionine (S)-S-oxide reductase MsrA [Aequorivita lipolytica]TXD68641.1 peptide-methionine (S)-S-oxide reductase MsrA [Aequorivita lipolytica]SRX53219.1 Peptide methionine sulfoxide reductase MsrA 2 [Aequorivita lipolytica]